MPYLVRENLFIGNIGDAAEILQNGPIQNQHHVAHILSVLNSASISFFSEWRTGLSSPTKEITKVYIGDLAAGTAGPDLKLVRMVVPLKDTENGNLLGYLEVYKELNGKVRDAIISLIDQERGGEQIDRALLKNVLDIFVEIGMGQMDHYENDFEAAMLKDTSAYYSRKASNWIIEDSCPDYMLKAEEWLKREKDRVAHYLHPSSEPKLLEKVQHELLSVYASQLLEKEHSGCHALLRDDKVEDLSRMFRLFSKIPRGLDPVSSIFKQHTTEGMALVKLAERCS